MGKFATDLDRCWRPLSGPAAAVKGGSRDRGLDWAAHRHWRKKHTLLYYKDISAAAAAILDASRLGRSYNLANPSQAVSSGWRMSAP
jgi:hypothetical protein